MSKEFGKVLRRLREKQGLYQKDLAEELGLSQKTISFYEIGQQEPTIEMLIQIADYFNVTVDYLIGRENEGAAKITDRIVG